jgi:hypothetical protein
MHDLDVFAAAQQRARSDGFIIGVRSDEQDARMVFVPVVNVDDEFAPYDKRPPAEPIYSLESYILSDALRKHCYRAL